MSMAKNRPTMSGGFFYGLRTRTRTECRLRGELNHARGGPLVGDLSRTAMGAVRPTRNDRPTLLGRSVLSCKRSFTIALAMSPQPTFALVRAAIKRGRGLTPKVQMTQAVPAGPHTMTSPCQRLILRASTDDSCSLKRNALAIPNTNATIGAPPSGQLIS